MSEPEKEYTEEEWAALSQDEKDAILYDDLCMMFLGRPAAPDPPAKESEEE